MTDATFRWREAIARGLAFLPDKPEETVEATLASLWHAASGSPLSAAAAQGVALPPLDEAASARMEALVQRRLQGEPLAHLTGRQRFLGLEMLAGPGALIPRVETELLAGAAIERLRTHAGNARVVDVCTGSGNVALAIAANVPGARVHAADISAEAVELARRNASFLGLAGVDFRVGDLLAPFDEAAFLGQVDLLTCNPPYISSAKVDALPEETGRNEPRLAFDGGPLGIRILNRFITDAPRFVRTGGHVLMEVGLGQARGVRGRMEKAGRYADFVEVPDAHGQVRVLGATIIEAAS